MNDTKVKVYTSLTAPDDIGLITHADYRALEEELAALRGKVETMFGKGRRDDCDCQECVSFRILRTKS